MDFKKADVINENTSFFTMKVNQKYAFVSDWFLMGSPVPVSLILGFYVLFVVKLGPELMKNRKPFQLRNILLMYNVAQVWISYNLFRVALDFISIHGWVPTSCVLDNEAVRHTFSSTMYWYLAAKFSELLDTVFFVLRKKDNQITFLHVYHHSLVAAVTWIALKYEPHYLLSFLGCINSFVHMVMYGYYGLAAYPSLAKYLWWKRYITSMQMIQFVMIIVHFFITYAVTECKPSRFLSYTMISNLVLFIFLFGKFYVNSYLKRNKDEATDNFKLKNKTKSKENSGNKAATEKNGKVKELNKKKYTIETAYMSAGLANRKTNAV